MTDIKERTVQDVFDDERKNDNRIEELEEEIEYVKQLKEELKECKKKILDCPASGLNASQPSDWRAKCFRLSVFAQLMYEKGEKRDAL